MKETLAKRLVAELMHWDLERATKEFAWLDLMVNYKFNSYQQYGPGRRFYVHLLRWLSQYELADRECIWKLLREQLVYISQDEMHHLVSLTGPIIEREMRSAVARQFGLPVYRVDEDSTASHRLKEMQCRTLYVGVSDGARIDVFRRYNEGTVNNEQIVAMIEISELKQAGLKEKLKERLGSIESSAPATFEWVCLIDDFTASGTTSIREESGSRWSGKVKRFIKEVEKTRKSVPLITDDAYIQVHHYLASRAASTKVSGLLERFQEQLSGIRFLSSFSYVLPDEVVVASKTHPKLSELLERNYDPGIETTHTGPGIALGYKQCGLPLVLDHNTPNNSLATLWARSDPKADRYHKDNHMSPLFPRRQRHSDVRS
jgi:hypothetical protein